MTESPAPATKVTAERIAQLLARATITVSKLGEKTCCVHVRLKNGYELTETASCVDPGNYSEEIGRKLGLKRVEDRLYQLEGWRLQCYRDGEP